MEEEKLLNEINELVGDLDPQKGIRFILRSLVGEIKFNRARIKSLENSFYDQNAPTPSPWSRKPLRDKD